MVNDDELREAVKYFRENGTMTRDQAKKRIIKKISMMKKNSVNKINNNINRQAIVVSLTWIAIRMSFKK